MNIDATKLLCAMAEKGWNFKRLSNESGVSRATLSYVKNGKSCSPDVAMRISRALEKSITELVGG